MKWNNKPLGFQGRRCSNKYILLIIILTNNYSPISKAVKLLPKNPFKKIPCHWSAFIWMYLNQHKSIFCILLWLFYNFYIYHSIAHANHLQLCLHSLTFLKVSVSSVNKSVLAATCHSKEQSFTLGRIHLNFH
jgi:hypothetical protein